MMKIHKSSYTKVLTLATLLSLSSSVFAEKLKVGFIYNGPVGEIGWSYQHDVGRREVERHFGDKVETTYLESVSGDDATTAALEQLANTGHKLIFACSYDYINPLLSFARKHPEIKFEHTSGEKRLPNLANYSARFYEARYLSGIIAAKMSKTNTIGVVASIKIPETIRGINATLIGARTVTPTAKVKVAWVGSWFNPEKEAEIAQKLIDAGADVITQQTDSEAVAQTAEANDVWFIASASDLKAYAPTKQLTSVIDNWGPYYVEKVQEVMSNTWKSESSWSGFDKNMVVMASLNPAIPKAIQKEFREETRAIKTRQHHPFTGPLKDTSGNLFLKAGKEMGLNELIYMDKFVEGVEFLN